MAHPFFEVSVYPWHRPEANPLYRALYQAIPSPARIDLLYRQSAENLPPLALGAPPSDIWKAALEGLTTHTALRRFCELLQQGPEQNIVSVQNAIRDVQLAQPAVEKRVFSDGEVVLDRITLREQLKLLESDESLTKVLIVRGAPGSGKSHGQLLFERAAREQGAKAVNLYEGMVVTVDDVIAELFAALEALNQIPPRQTTEDAWYREVCRKLEELASTKKQRVWIAIDDLGIGADGAPLLDTQILEFCKQFVLRMGNYEFRRWFRLMLIDFPDGKTPTKWPKGVLAEDRTSDADVQQEHVKELLQVWLLMHDRKMIEDDLTRESGEILAEGESLAVAGTDKMPRLQGIHDAVVKRLKKLAGGSQ